MPQPPGRVGPQRCWTHGKSSNSRARLELAGKAWSGQLNRLPGSVQVFTIGSDRPAAVAVDHHAFGVPRSPTEQKICRCNRLGAGDFLISVVYVGHPSRCDLGGCQPTGGAGQATGGWTGDCQLPACPVAIFLPRSDADQRITNTYGCRDPHPPGTGRSIPRRGPCVSRLSELATASGRCRRLTTRNSNDSDCRRR